MVAHLYMVEVVVDVVEVEPQHLILQWRAVQAATLVYTQLVVAVLPAQTDQLLLLVVTDILGQTVTLPKVVKAVEVEVLLNLLTVQAVLVVLAAVVAAVVVVAV